MYIAGATDFRLFMSLPPDISPQELKDYFSQYGNVSDVYLPRGRNIAYISYQKDVEMFAALAAAEEHVLNGHEMKVCLPYLPLSLSLSFSLSLMTLITRCACRWCKLSLKASEGS